MRVVLAQALRVQFQPEAASVFREAMAGCGVTERLLTFADACYALPLLASAIRRAGPFGASASGVGGAHSGLGAILDNAYYACAARKVALLALIERVADVLIEGQIPFLLLKGAALEVLAPRAPAVRVTADLDVLVPRGSMARVERLLAEAGFQPRYADHAETFRRHGHHAVPYEAGRGLGAVEVHETLAPRGASVRLPIEPFWRRSRRVIWRQREIQLPAAEELVLHTCAHYGLLHPYNTTLRRLWDLAVILRTAGDAASPTDWEYVTATARRWGARKVLERALLELAWLFPAEPEPAQSACCDPGEWPLFEAPYSALAAFCLEQRATDNAWGRLRGLWRFLLPGPHETAPVRAERAHWRYLLDRFGQRSPGRRSRMKRQEAPASESQRGKKQGSDDD